MVEKPVNSDPPHTPVPGMSRSLLLPAQSEGPSTGLRDVPGEGCSPRPAPTPISSFDARQYQLCGRGSFPAVFPGQPRL